MKRFDIDGNPEPVQEEVIFASTLTTFEPIRDGDDIIFASTLPEAKAEVVATERPARVEAVAVSLPAAVPASAPVTVDVDRLWAAFDAGMAEEISRGLCPHCGSPLVMDWSRDDVTCSTCGSSYASFHAWVPQGNA